MDENVMKFEDKLKRLEEIVNSLESDDIELEKSLALYEEGINLVRLCTEELDAAQEKINILSRE